MFLKPFNRVFYIPFIVLAVFSVWAVGGSEVFAEGNTATGRDYNLILIFVDTLRSDHLGAYGYKRDTSSNMDALVGDGILFENVVTPHTVTIASFMSIITSLYPDSHGVRYVMKDRLSERVTTLAEVLKAEDFETHWLGPWKDPHLDSSVGYGRGFDTFGIFPTDLAQARKVLHETLERAKDRRFFLNFHTYKVHEPYFPSDKYRYTFAKGNRLGLIDTHEALEEATVNEFRKAVVEKRGLVEEEFGRKFVSRLAKNVEFGESYIESRNNIFRYLDTIKQRHIWSFMMSHIYLSRASCEDRQSIDQIKDYYDSTILEFDTEIIGPLVTYLKENELYDKTVIAVVADHGEEFCEHGSLRHGSTLYGEATRVPFILRVPHLERGRRVNSMLQTVDILPTLLDVLGVDIPPQAQGISAAGLLEGGGDKALRNYAFGSLTFLTYVQTDKWKLIKPRNCTNFRMLPRFICRALPWLLEEESELYNLELDPEEQENLYADHPDVAAELEKELAGWKRSLPSHVYGENRAFAPDLDEKTKDRIRRTGYW